jgi:pimeloyl-ACP methyl ester carboxylesterase
LVATIYGGQDGVAQRMAAGRKARSRYEETDEVEYVPAASDSDPSAAMYGAFDYYLDPGRGNIPEWANRYAVMAWPEWLTFDPVPVAERITVPTLLVHSEDAAIPEGVRRFHAGLTGPKELVWLTGTQFDFYDQEPNVTAAISHVIRHLAATLGRP